MPSKALKRHAASVAVAGAVVVSASAMVFAATWNGPYAYQFTVYGGGGVGCTQQTRTASNYGHPLINVELSSVSGGAAGGNFTAANANCEQLQSAEWLTIDSGTGYHWIDLFDSPGERIKLMGETFIDQGNSQYTGNWET